MINLNNLIAFPAITLICVIITNSNYKIKSILNKIENFIFSGLLEESHSMISRVLQKYYLKVINVASNLFSWLLSSSFWYNNIENEKEKEVNERKTVLNIILKKVGLFLSLIAFNLVTEIWVTFKPLEPFFQGVSELLSSSDAKLSNFDMQLAIDALSISFVLLIGVVLPIVYW
jgi:hypothetical protein